MEQEPFDEPNTNEDIKTAELTTRWMYYQAALDEMQKEKQQLAEEVQSLNEKLFKEKADKTDIYFYLNEKLDENYNVIATMENQVPFFPSLDSFHFFPSTVS